MATCRFLRKAVVSVLVLVTVAGRPAVAEEPLLRFVQWNDTHVQATMPFPFRWTNLVYLVSAMNDGAYFPTPDFVVGVGDMIHGASPADFSDDFNLLKTGLAPLACDYYPVIGNHENYGQENNPIYEAAYTAAFGAERLNYSFRAGGIEFIMLNATGAPSSNDTGAGAYRRQWLQGILEASPGVPKIICTHIPFVPIREEAVLVESFGFGSYITHDDEMLAIVEAYSDDVLAVLAGHLHLSGVVQQNGIAHIVTSGTHGYPYDFASYEVYSNRVSVNMHTLPPELHVPSPITHGIPRHAVDYTDATHPTHDLYLRGNPSERSFDIPFTYIPPKVFENGDFEADPFTNNWVDTLSAIETDGLDGSATAVYVDNENMSGSLTQAVSSIEANWAFEMSFAAADHATGRSLNLGLTHHGSMGINLRTISTDLQVYDEGSGWQTLMAGVVDFSVDADGDNDFTSPGDTLVVYRLRIEGHYGVASPYYDVFLSDGDSTDVNDNTALSVQYWQGAAPTTGQGLYSVAFYATGSVGGDYVVDNVSISTVVPSTILNVTAVPSGNIKMVVNAPGAANFYSPMATTSLVEGTWVDVLHSDAAEGSYYFTNLNHSTPDATGTNEVIYLQADAPAKFFKIILE